MEPSWQFRRGVTAACVLTAAGASMDACVYIGHGHVLASVQTGNIVLAATHIAARQPAEAMRHVPSFLAFCLGVAAARVSAAGLKRRQLDARPLRLGVEAAALAALAAGARRMPDAAVVACVAFLAAFQISSYSHLGGQSFNTGMTTGNLWNGLSALARVLTGETERGTGLRKAAVLGLLVASFMLGAISGSYATLRVHDASLLYTAGLTGLAAALLRGLPDPL